MNRVTRGMVVLAAALATVSCSGDPTASLRNGIDHLIATPAAIFLAEECRRKHNALRAEQLLNQVRGFGGTNPPR